MNEVDVKQRLSSFVKTVVMLCMYPVSNICHFGTCPFEFTTKHLCPHKHKKTPMGFLYQNINLVVTMRYEYLQILQK